MSDTLAAAPATKPETEMQMVECLYVGRRVLSSGKLAEGYMTVEQAGEIPVSEWERFESAVSLFEPGKKSKAHARSGAVVGGVYKMEAKLTDGRITTAKTGTREYLRRYDNHETVVECEVKDNAAAMHERSARIMAKLKTDSVLVEELRGLRGLYKRTPYADRPALELLVLNALRRESRT